METLRAVIVVESKVLLIRREIPNSFYSSLPSVEFDTAGDNEKCFVDDIFEKHKIVVKIKKLLFESVHGRVTYKYFLMDWVAGKISSKTKSISKKGYDKFEIIEDVEMFVEINVEELEKNNFVHDEIVQHLLSLKKK